LGTVFKGKEFCFLTLEDEPDMLSRNFGKKITTSCCILTQNSAVLQTPKIVTHVKDKIFPVHAIEVYGCEGATPLVLKLGKRWG
jgi:hypothetical protein